MPDFVLDQNFPIAATGIPWPPSIRLKPLEVIDPRLVAGHEDWQVLLELGRRDDVDGFITNDGKILNLPTEMVVMADSDLTLVITDGVGDDLLQATGLLMLYLVQIATQMDAQTRRRPHIYRLRPGDLGRQQHSPREFIRKIADNQYAQIDQLMARERAKIKAWR